MWFGATAVVLSTLSLTWVHAASRLGDNPTALATLQTKAEQAEPRDRCFLYAKLVSQMTDLAGRELHSGDLEGASETLKLVAKYAEKLHLGVADNSKKIKDAEVLMQRTSFRLKDLLGAASYEDRQALQAEATGSGSGAAHDAGLQTVACRNSLSPCAFPADVNPIILATASSCPIRATGRHSRSRFEADKMPDEHDLLFTLTTSH